MLPRSSDSFEVRCPRNSHKTISEKTGKVSYCRAVMSECEQVILVLKDWLVHGMSTEVKTKKDHFSLKPKPIHEININKYPSMEELDSQRPPSDREGTDNEFLPTSKYFRGSRGRRGGRGRGRSHTSHGASSSSAPPSAPPTLPVASDSDSSSKSSSSSSSSS